MKRTLMTLLVAALSLLPLAAQNKTPKETYEERYSLLVSKLGADGVGVETLLNHWASDYPDDVDMLLGKFSYYLAKSRSITLEQRDAAKYLGTAPTLTLKDSLDRDVNYFQVTNYDDEIFGKASQAIDKAIELEPERLDLRFYKISSLIGYEKESPDMALSVLNGLIDYNGKTHPKWTYPDLEIDDDVFCDLIQDYCFQFFKLGTPSGYDAFKGLAEKMLSYYPAKTVFLSDIATYYFVYKKDNKTALKMYNKVLKKNPDDYQTIKNLVLMARTEKDVKLEKKYLPSLIRVTPDETEKASAQARLGAL